MNERLGYTYRDAITGFIGVATGHCVYISGCNQTLLVPKTDDKGGHRDGQWFDDQRLTVETQIPRVTLNNGATPGCDRAAPKR